MRRAIRPGGLLAVVLLALFLGSAQSQAVQAAPAADSIIHIVQPGESLYLIGLQYGVSWSDIMLANQLPTATIYVGQQLIIPGGQTASTPAPAATAEPSPLPDDTSNYVVRHGDSLSAIARRVGLTVADLVGANNLANPSLIFAGQVLDIPDAQAADGAAAPAPITTDPTAGREPGPDNLILVSISEQRMTVYQNGGVLYQWAVSTGEPGLDTWPGQYSVLDKIPNAYGANWDLWMPNWLGIYWAGDLENGIHALPILPNGLRLWDGYLGTRVSFGCVILGVQEAQTLYDWAEVGTPVNIQE
jgi:LysM repeat protein